LVQSEQPAALFRKGGGMTRAGVNSVVVGLLVGAILIGCGGSAGACIVKSPLGGLYDYCHDDYTSDECAQLSDSRTSGNSCASLGYKKVCSDDTSNTYRMNCP
jgi:hypothetical protein